MLYHSLKDEVQTHSFIEKWSKKKTIILPVVVGEELELRLYTGPQDLAIGAYGIAEPTGKVFTDYKAIDLAVIPGTTVFFVPGRITQSGAPSSRVVCT